MTMNTAELTDKLRVHLRSVEKSGSDIYIMKLKQTIEKLERNYYDDNQNKLIHDLRSLGFNDYANQFRKRMFI